MILTPSSIPSLDSLIGQETLKLALTSVTSALAAGGAFKSFIISGEPGMGKGAFSKAWGKQVMECTGWNVFFLNLKGKFNVTEPVAKDFFALMEDCLTGGSPGIFILNEYGTAESTGSLPAEIAGILSKVGEAKGKGEVIKIYGRGEFAFDPRRLGFVITSWRDGKSQADLRSRFPESPEFTLQPYSETEIIQIIKLSIKSVWKTDGNSHECPISITPSAVSFLAESMRGNPRKAENPLAYKLARKALVEGTVHIDKPAAIGLAREIGLLPFGLSVKEGKLLNLLLQVNGQKTFTALCASVGLATGGANSAAAQADLFLTTQGGKDKPFQLMKGDEPIKDANGPLIGTYKGKAVITEHGARVLGNLKKAGFNLA